MPHDMAWLVLHGHHTVCMAYGNAPLQGGFTFNKPRQFGVIAMQDEIDIRMRSRR